MRIRRALFSVLAALALAVPLSLTTVSPASADTGVVTCDDGGGGIVGHTNGSQCAAYHNWYLTTHTHCTVSIGDEPIGPTDTIIIACVWGWAYTATPPPVSWDPPAPPPPCSYSDPDMTTGTCDDSGSVDTPAGRQALVDFLDGSLLAGSGSPLGSQSNPIPLDASKYTPPPPGPHVWRSKTLDEAGQGALVGCVWGGGFGAAIGFILKPDWRAAAGGFVIGCGGTVAATYGALLYKSHVHTWYPVVNGEPSGNPADWYTCTDVRVVPATANSWNPADVVYFRYPDAYPDLGGTVQPYARVCEPFKT